MSYALEVSNVYKKYKNFTALNNVNFQIQQGDFVGLLGVNGAGKTSLISSIAGVNHFEGEIKVMGHNVIAEHAKAKLCLGVVPQEIIIDPFLTVYETLQYQSGLYGVVKNNEWLDEILQRMCLMDKRNMNTKTLSGGMKRRLMVAQALVHKPKVIILDEPTAGVDIEIRKNIWEFILDLNKQGHTILLTTHYLEEIEKLCNKIIMIHNGEITAQKTINEFLYNSFDMTKIIQIETHDRINIPKELEPLIVSYDGCIYNFQLHNNDKLLDILLKLEQFNIKIKNIQIKEPSVEEVFLKYLNK